MDIKDAKKKLIFETIVGSHAYGLNTPYSDTDKKGIFLLSNTDLLTLNNYTPQVSDKKNDIVYYELNRFAELLATNNPNILEILYTPENKQIYKHPIFDNFIENRDLFLTKQCKHTFGGYAISQIKKARGLNKKIVNPVDKKKKTPLDFCYIINKDTGYMTLAKKWLKKENLKQEYIGLSEMPNGNQLYKVYYDWLAETKSDNPRYKGINSYGFKGIISENGNDIRHSQIPKDHRVLAFLYFNLEGYSSYCKKYKEYWEWVNNRNENRYLTNINAGASYDTKNLMHCVRLLDSAIYIGKYRTLKIEPDNKEFLFSIRYGKLPYKDIIRIVEDKKEELDKVFDESNIPETVNVDMINDLILKTRNII